MDLLLAGWAHERRRKIQRSCLTPLLHKRRKKEKDEEGSFLVLRGKGRVGGGRKRQYSVLRVRSLGSRVKEEEKFIDSALL